tara:strand:+ start:123 stop:1151 length:1029 start_codon:yes stop_codon:yes gene_type:complete
MPLDKKMIKKNCLSYKKKLTDVFKKFKILKKKIIFIEKGDKLVGTITDGDIRKIHFSNKNKNLSVLKVMNAKPQFLLRGFKKTKLNKISYKIRYLPILSNRRKIVNILDLDVHRNLKYENHIIIFAGGEGKRLRPFTKNIPKPMLVIKNKPNLEILIKKIYNQGFKNINLSLHYKHNYIVDKLGKDKKFSNVKFNIERKPLGTAGGLSQIEFNNNLPIIAINADLITNLDLSNLIHYHKSIKSDFTISVKKRLFKVPFATVEIKNEKITSIQEKPSKDLFFNAGIYVIDQKILKLLRINKRIDMPDLIQKAIKKEYKINGFYMYEDWLDFGTKETFLKLRKK